MSGGSVDVEAAAHPAALAGAGRQDAGTDPVAEPGATEPKETALADVHRRLGAKLVPFAGFRMPVQYRSILDEHRAVRERAGLFDISHMGELYVSGPGAKAFLDRVTVNDVNALAAYQAQYSCICREDGGIVDDVVVYRLDGEYLVVANASNTIGDREWLLERLPSDVTLEDRSDRVSLLALQGPRAEQILARLAALDLSRLAFYHAAEAVVAGVPALISRTGYTGEDGFELYFDREASVEVWSALLGEGERHGLVPAGLGARDTLRLEMKYALYGNDIDETTNPIEAGLGWVVRLEKGDFVGRESLARVKAEGPRRRLVGFRVEERSFPRPGQPVLLGGERVSEVRSGTVSPTLGVGIGTCYLPAEAARPGTALELEVRGRRVPARVARTPFYTGGSLKREAR